MIGKDLHEKIKDLAKSKGLKCGLSDLASKIKEENPDKVNKTFSPARLLPILKNDKHISSYVIEQLAENWAGMSVPDFYSYILNEDETKSEEKDVPNRVYLKFLTAADDYDKDIEHLKRKESDALCLLSIIYAELLKNNVSIDSDFLAEYLDEQKVKRLYKIFTKNKEEKISDEEYIARIDELLQQNDKFAYFYSNYYVGIHTLESPIYKSRFRKIVTERIIEKELSSIDKETLEVVDKTSQTDTHAISSSDNDEIETLRMTISRLEEENKTLQDKYEESQSTVTKLINKYVL